MKKILLLTLLLHTVLSCKDFLDVKPDSKMATITSSGDLWAILDNELIFNSVSLLGEDLSDNYYMKEQTWSSTTNENVRNKYTWSNTENDDIGWATIYNKIYHANVVLEGARKISSKIPEKEYREIMGTALYYRSLFFYEVLSIYSLPYHVDSGSQELGIPLRTTADINKTFPRASIVESIDLIVNDLQTCIDYLPLQTASLTRPSRLAVWSLLARVFFDIGNYQNSFDFSKKALDIKDNLLDYNLIDCNLDAPFELFNEEVIHLTYNYSSLLTQNRSVVDSNLMSSYVNGDRRKKCFFTKNNEDDPVFKGSYMQNANTQFTGSTTGELYLIFIESAIRTDRIEEARDRLEVFLSNRYEKGTAPFVKNEKEDLIGLVLNERRKELLFRNRRWMDIKRLNLEGESIILKRKLNEETFELLPNSLEYAVLIPLEAIELGGIQQNKRK